MYPQMPDYKRKARRRMRAGNHPEVSAARDRMLAEPPTRSPQSGQALPMAGPSDNSGQTPPTAPASAALEQLAAQQIKRHFMPIPRSNSAGSGGANIPALVKMMQRTRGRGR